MIEYEIQTDEPQRRVWVHASDGSTVARFDTRFGMDILRRYQSKRQALPSACTAPTADRRQKIGRCFEKRSITNLAFSFQRMRSLFLACSRRHPGQIPSDNFGLVDIPPPQPGS